MLNTAIKYFPQRSNPLGFLPHNIIDILSVVKYNTRDKGWRERKNMKKESGAE